MPLTVKDLGPEFRSPAGHIMGAAHFAVVLDAQGILSYETARKIGAYLFEKVFRERLPCIPSEARAEVAVYLPDTEEAYVTEVIVPGIEEILSGAASVTYVPVFRKLTIERNLV